MRTSLTIRRPGYVKCGFTFALLWLAGTGLVLAQAPAPKPDPALKKLQPLVGQWTCEGEYIPGALAPGGKYTCKYTAQMFGGVFLEEHVTEKGAAGELRGLGIEAYDPVNKNFVSNWYFSDGSRFSGTITVNGSTLTWAGKWVIAGKPYQFKEPFIFAPDLMSATNKCEISNDGKTWMPWYEEKWAKAKPAAKK